MKALLVLYNCNLNNFNNDYDLIIGIDRGAYNLASNNIKMDIAYGDFDSVNEAEFELIKKYSKKIVKLNPIKDLSDTYQVIKDYKNYDITILGGIYGKRIEHFYSNLLSLINYDNIKIMDENSLIIKCKKGVYKNNPKIWDEFVALKESGKVQKIGFSLYTPEELQFILDNKSPFDLIQVPFNIFDKKFLPLMKEVHDKGVEIHVRSTFLQGLFFKDRETLPEKLKPMKKYLLQLDEFSKHSGLSISEIALNYNLQNPYIDGVLIGVDNVEQLKTNLSAVKDTPIDIEIEVKEQELLNPVNWN